ncbi:unnamed protein product [Psylliodes chrysocephalus]|uniref:DUF4371 domain-containing protein n=1 Tax=Psylliodes chrysocephalus TaxID=3402493 RepID=A0A9P0D9P7_9CUCU|nr:unnamed protein product [Psylliodes chrysocephala]
MQMVLIIRYVRDGRIYERFSSFLRPMDHTADGLSAAILEVLSELGIDKVPEKLIAQSYDGDSVMSGIVGGVQATISNIYANAQYIHCYAHQLNLIIEKCCSIDKAVRVFFANLSAFSAYFSRSTKRTIILDRVVKKRLPRSAPTRWNFTSKCQYYLCL